MNTTSNDRDLCEYCEECQKYHLPPTWAPGRSCSGGRRPSPTGRYHIAITYYPIPSRGQGLPRPPVMRDLAGDVRYFSQFADAARWLAKFKSEAAGYKWTSADYQRPTYVVAKTNAAD